MIWVVLLAALIIRIIDINQSLWLDEADNLVAAKINTFASFVTRYPIGDFHPPGYFALLWAWTHFFGFSEITARLPSVLLGIGTVALIYLLGKKLFDTKVALIAAVLLAVAPLHVYYSQEARMYSLATFSAVLSMYFFVKLINQERWSTPGYIISTVLVLYSDYVVYLIIPAQLIYLLLIKHNIWKRFLPSLLMAILGLLPWFFILPQQIIEGSKASTALPSWKKVAGGTDLKNILLVFVKTIFGRISFDNKLFYGLSSALLTAVYGLVIFLGVKKWDQGTKLLLSWLIVPMVLVILISSFIPLLSYFRMIFILPAFYLLVARGVLMIPRIYTKIVLVFLVLVSLLSLWIYYSTFKFQREDWRGSAKFLENVSKDRAIILFEDNHVKFPYLYYQKGEVPAFGGLKNVQARSLEDVGNIEEFLNGRNQIYLFEYLVEITDPNRFLEKKIASLGFKKSDVYNFHGVGLVTLYEIR